MQAKTPSTVALIKKAADLDSIRAQRLTAVARVLNREPLDSVAASIGFTPQTLRTWVKGYLNRGANGLEWLASKPGPKSFKLTQAKVDDPEEFYRRLRESAPQTWLWLNNDRGVAVTLANVYNWRKKLLKDGTL